MYLKKRAFIVVFIASNVIFVFLQIYNHARYIQQTYTKQIYEKKTYTKQIYEKKYNALGEKKQKIIQQLYELEDQVAIKKFAQDILHMQANKLKQVKKIT